jgi:hypothetical protein
MFSPCKLLPLVVLKDGGIKVRFFLKGDTVLAPMILLIVQIGTSSKVMPSGHHRA